MQTIAGDTAVFVPETGYAGSASFELLGNDGWEESAPQTITVQISDAPLVRLDYVLRNPRLNLGMSLPLTLVGDFADEQGVVLSAPFIEFESLNPATVFVSDAGRVTAIANGASAVVASAQGLQAVTAIVAGDQVELIDQFVDALGITSYPAAVSLPAAIGQRQLRINLTDETRLYGCLHRDAVFQFGSAHRTSLRGWTHHRRCGGPGDDHGDSRSRRSRHSDFGRGSAAGVCGARQRRGSRAGGRRHDDSDPARRADTADTRFRSPPSRPTT